MKKILVAFESESVARFAKIKSTVQAALDVSPAVSSVSSVSIAPQAVAHKGNATPKRDSVATSPDAPRQKMTALVGAVTPSLAKRLTKIASGAVQPIAASLSPHSSANIFTARRPGLASRWKDAQRVQIER